MNAPTALSPGASLEPPVREASPEDVTVLCAALQAFNRPFAGDIAVTPINLSIRDDDGALLGGLLAEYLLGWVEIHVLWVDPARRGSGLGAALLRECEQRALGLGAGWARLDTFDWQAEGFYLRQGYECFARLPNYPGSHERVFLRKRLGPMPRAMG